MVPSTTTSRALMLAMTLPFGPTVKRCSCNSTVPSTSPSIVKSSRLKIWPLTITDLPNTADPPRGLSKWGSLTRAGSVDIEIASFASADDVGGADAGLSANSSSFRRFHIGIASLHQHNFGASPSPRERTSGAGSPQRTRRPSDCTYTTTASPDCAFEFCGWRKLLKLAAPASSLFFEPYSQSTYSIPTP